MMRNMLAQRASASIPVSGAQEMLRKHASWELPG